nr:uncharacterized protein LOC126053911 [Helicoverpa armigera]
MVITRSQSDLTELEEQRRASERRDPGLLASLQRREAERIARERMRRLSMDPPASPQVEQSTLLATEHAVAGPSSRSVRSTTSATTRLRLAELEAAEKLAALTRRELEMEAELVKKRLAAEVSVIQDDQESVQDEALHDDHQHQHNKVSQWLNTHTPAARGEGAAHTAEEHRPARDERPRERSPSRNRNSIDQLAVTLEKMARPRLRHTDLPAFSGTVSEWLAFKAAFNDTTNMYTVSTAENLQRLRTCLKGEAREAVAALLHTATDPAVIMRTLEQCFGRPEMIIDKALDELKRVPRPGSSAAELNSFAVKVQNTICTLKAIDRRGYLYNPLLTREILEKLSPHLKSRWCDFACDNEGTAEPEICSLARFLMREADRALRYTYSTVASASTAGQKREVRPAASKFPVAGKKKQGAVYAAIETAADQCFLCKENHALTQCPKYKAMDVGQRWEFVKENGICFKCAVKKHRRVLCRAKPCGQNECRRPHHVTLHSDPPAKKEETVTPKTQAEEAVMSVANRAAADNRAVLLKMCPVVIGGPRGEVRTHALLDEGATITLIDSSLAESIGAEGTVRPLHICGVNMSSQEEDSQVVTIKIRGVGKECSPHQLQARTIKDLKLHQQTVPASLLGYKHLRDLPANEVCYAPTRPGVLIGTDHWEHIVSRELRVGGPNQPAASRTQLGWVVHGTAPRTLVATEGGVLHIHERDMKGDNQLHELVEAHFKIEALGVTHKPRVSDADRRAQAIVEATTTAIEGGYQVGLPWREDAVSMPPSYKAALRRLIKIEQKMDAAPEFAVQYTSQIDNLLDKGYAVPCDGTEKASPKCWYLPHFAVQNPNKPGKQRLVFDAAARSNGVCLNDALLEGPDLLLSLPGIIFRFREKAVAITADIQEMFLRIKIRPEDQPAQQFLWRGKDRSSPPREYKMTSMIFGAASSPFMAHYVRNHNAELHGEECPLALDAITRHHYMDDLVVSYDNADEAHTAVQELQKVHAVAGFTLRGWSSNDPGVLRSVPSELHTTAPTQLGGELPASKILGLYWSAERDELGFNTAMNRVPAEVRNRKRAPTKREALSAVMSIYDPLGLLSHYTVRAKIILQNLWRLQMSWDDSIPQEDNEQFSEWLSQLSNLTDLKLPRCYETTHHDERELHVLCDASEQAYAAVAYWRMPNKDGAADVVLVAAKAKVAPRKAQTIPRLELQAAVIGARLAEAIRKEHRLNITRTVYWTDSTTVVHWIQHDARRYTPFVAHRLGEIAELTSKEEWRWLPTQLNVADDATRLTDAPIGASDRWFQGPSFLQSGEHCWPCRASPEDDDEHETLHVAEAPASWLPNPARFSRYNVLVRATARALLFVDKCRRAATTLELRHIERAEKELLRRSQEESFADEMARMQSARPLPRTSRLYKLDPVMEDGLLRVRGRIEAATAPAETKRPVILDGRHPLTKLLVQKEHCAAGHANRERVTNDLRQRYWVLRLRPTVRAVEASCAFCRRRRAVPRPPATGDLPRARLDPFHRPFTNCGVDYFGPMNVKVGRRREKRWGALFTCLTCRAVHLELVASLSTDSAIMALRRMAARRGWPSIMYSDNGTNFRGADAELRAAYNEWLPALKEVGLAAKMEWRFIPPGAPNQGGAWERMVRTVKSALGTTLHERAPSEEVLLTLLTEAEFAVNARPLTHVSVNPLDPEALTPNHFLLGSSTGLPTTGPCDEADRRTWRAAQALADRFWARWVREYLPLLAPRGEPQNNERPLQTGDVVLIADGTLPRNVWPMGIVERTHPGPDGGIRVAEVRTRTGVFRRPVSKLVVLVKEEATRAAPGGELLRTPSLQ